MKDYMQEWGDLIVKLGVLPAIIAYLLYTRSREEESDKLAEKERNELERQKVLEHAAMRQEIHESNEILKSNTDALLVIKEFITSWKK